MADVDRRLVLRAGLVAVGAGATSACTADDAQPPSGSSPSAGSAGSAGSSGSPEPGHRVELGSGAALLDGATEPTVALSRVLFAAATAVVVAPPGSADVASGAGLATRLGVPLLVSGPQLLPELDRLGVRTVLSVATGTASLPPLGDREVLQATPEVAVTGLPLTPPADGAVLVVREGTAVPEPLEATLAAAGATRVVSPAVDVRAVDAVRDALRASSAGPVVGLGDLGPARHFAQRVRTTRRAPEVPGGGLLPFPGRRMVALYGHPLTKALGMLGEQGPEAAVRRARDLAGQYAQAVPEPVVPAFELIATVAVRSAQSDGSYSKRTAVDVLRRWVDVAERAGVYVVLDLQPGRSDFLTQARHYESLLRRPGVGLALDPEWRLAPGQKHLVQIGSVGIDEVNAVGAWLAGLVREHDLPPKVLVLHQFRPSMIRDRERLDTSLDEVQWLMHADGQGPQGAKQGTWARLREDLPDGVWLGWKNFEDEDTPVLTPRQTAERVRPVPWFVSYQ